MPVDASKLPNGATRAAASSLALDAGAEAQFGDFWADVVPQLRRRLERGGVLPLRSTKACRAALKLHCPDTGEIWARRWMAR